MASVWFEIVNYSETLNKNKKTPYIQDISFFQAVAITGKCELIRIDNRILQRSLPTDVWI